VKKREKKRKQQIHVVAGVMRAMDLPEETDSGIVKVTMLGHRRALIENHRGVYAYTEDGVSLTGAEGVISVSGEGLEIRQLDAERIWVEGYITGVYYGPAQW